MLFNILLKILISFLFMFQIHGHSSSKKYEFEQNKLEQNPDLFEGDMRFPDSSQLSSGIFRRGSSVAWVNGIIPYEIASGYGSKEIAIIISTMQKMEHLIAINNVQCIHFRPKTASDEYFITIRNGSGCSSYVGQNPSISMERTVTLEQPGCIIEGTIMHELLHILGFYHEQSRPDRDNYIRVNYLNVQTGMENYFDKYNSTHFNTQHTSYDYASLMHYEPYAFSSNGYPTIEPIQSGVTIGQRFNMSSADIEKVRLFYNCSSSGVTLSPIPITTKIATGLSINLRALYSVNTTISSSLTSYSSIYNRTGSSSGYYYYQSYEIHVPISGYYIFQSISFIDTYGYLYRTSFNPYNPRSNLIISDDDSGISNQFQFQTYLQASETYILIVTTYSSLVTGYYQLIVSGSYSVQILRLDSSLTCTITGYNYTSICSSELTRDSLTFTRYNSSGRFYYIPILITLSTSGIYYIQSTSSIDLYGYLYSNSFNRYSTAENLLVYNDDGATNRQFLIGYRLQASNQYILIVTTYGTYATGRFSIIISGPSTVDFTFMDNSSSTSSSTQQLNMFGIICLFIFVKYYIFQ